MGKLAATFTCLALSWQCMAQTWTRAIRADLPDGRRLHAMSYDALRRHVVLFGGQAPKRSLLWALNDTWTWDGKNWVQRHPKTSPPARMEHAMAFHAANVRTVVFGGVDNNYRGLGDTWTWDGSNWTKMNPKNSPSARGYVRMVYDWARQRTVLFSGSGLADTWEWDGVNWTQIKTKHSPAFRARYGMVYDRARRRIVLFGGDNSSGYLNDTWEYDGKDWKQIKTTVQPSPRLLLGMTYDQSRHRTVLHKGDTWEYDGKNWTQINVSPSPPARLDTTGMVYDLARKVTVLFGGQSGKGFLNDTWEYVGPQQLTGSPATLSITTGGTHAFGLDAGPANARRLYSVFGSVTGTSPGVTLQCPSGSLTIPLNPDVYTDVTIALANTPLLTKTRGTLDNQGKATASLNVPKIANTAAVGLKLYHAYLVYDAKNNFYMASNPVELMLVK